MTSIDEVLADFLPDEHEDGPWGYVTVQPDGLVLPDERKARSELEGVVLDVSRAATLYKRARQQCRTLNGVRAFSGRMCATCPDRPGVGACVAGLRVDLGVEGSRKAARFILIHTNAQGFARWAWRARGELGRVVGQRVRLTVSPRKNPKNKRARPWGAIAFESP